MTPDFVDRLLLQFLQDEFPLEPDPWQVLGQKLNLSGEEVLRRVRNLRSCGILRGICPILESGKVGIGASTLVALRIPDGRVEEIAQTINGYPQVSHNYLRDHEYNLWFTLGARDRVELELILHQIKDRCRINGRDVLDLPIKRRFKIDVRFPMVQQGGSS
jgi:siroheme decarboxylase